MTDHPDLTLIGWRVRSAIPILALPGWNGPPGQPVDVSIIRGPVAARAGNGAVEVTVQDDGSALVLAEGVGRFEVRDGRTVVADVDPSAFPGAVEASLLGPVFGALCYQRGLQAFHCNTVVIGGQAVALSGVTGAGKSTLGGDPGRHAGIR